MQYCAPYLYRDLYIMSLISNLWNLPSSPNGTHKFMITFHSFRNQNDLTE